MATAVDLLSEVQCRCPICLAVFTDPVTIPCGHNFCKTCITKHWDSNARCRCPLCNKCFGGRPELHVNTFVSEVTALFRQSVQKEASRVDCDVCTETKEKALKSCLVCLTSYCETHLKPHQMFMGLKKHTLIDPVENPRQTAAAGL